MRQISRKGATSSEYLFCAVLIIVAVLASVVSFGSRAQKTMQSNSTEIEQALDN